MDVIWQFENNPGVVVAEHASTHLPVRLDVKPLAKPFTCSMKSHDDKFEAAYRVGEVITVRRHSVANCVSRVIGTASVSVLEARQ